MTTIIDAIEMCENKVEKYQRDTNNIKEVKRR